MSLFPVLTWETHKVIHSFHTWDLCWTSCDQLKTRPFLCRSTVGPSSLYRERLQKPLSGLATVHCYKAPNGLGNVLQSPHGPAFVQSPLSQSHCVQHSVRTCTCPLPMLGSNLGDSFHPADSLPSLLFLHQQQLPFLLLEQMSDMDLTSQHPKFPRLWYNMRLCSIALCLSAGPRRYCYHIIPILMSQEILRTMLSFFIKISYDNRG